MYNDKKLPGWGKCSLGFACKEMYGPWIRINPNHTFNKYLSYTHSIYVDLFVWAAKVTCLRKHRYYYFNSFLKRLSGVGSKPGVILISFIFSFSPLYR
jgi:hypothetical protein